jgi:hypothetical protein
MDMKPAISLLILVLLAGCKHDRDETCSGAVTITGSAPGCGGWGIVVDGVKYPSGNIPDSFKQDGLPVCAQYDIYVDMRYCACCGGNWANIITMTRR